MQQPENLSPGWLRTAHGTGTAPARRHGGEGVQLDVHGYAGLRAFEGALVGRLRTRRRDLDWGEPWTLR